MIFPLANKETIGVGSRITCENASKCHVLGVENQLCRRKKEITCAKQKHIECFHLEILSMCMTFLESNFDGNK